MFNTKEFGDNKRLKPPPPIVKRSVAFSVVTSPRTVANTGEDKSEVRVSHDGGMYAASPLNRMFTAESQSFIKGYVAP